MHYAFGKTQETKIRWNRIDLPNVPLFSAELPQKVVNRLWEYIDKAKEDEEKNSQNRTLAGNISSSLTLHDKDDFIMKEVFEKIIYSYIDPKQVGVKWNRIFTSHAHPKYSLRSLWVNFQNKHEFNPVHDHAGIFSFVIWLKMPTSWKEQHNISISKNSNSPAAGNFQFVYTDIIGNVVTYDVPMSEEIENMIVIFPSQLKHLVYPFYECDEQRISVAGNINIDSTTYTDWI